MPRFPEARPQHPFGRYAATGGASTGRCPTGQAMTPGEPYSQGAASAPAPAPAPAAPPPISADTLYQNALRDFTGGKYDLSRQEFSDYIQNFPSNDLASNSQFYLGEMLLRAERFQGRDRGLRCGTHKLSKELQARGFPAEKRKGGA